MGDSACIIQSTQNACHRWQIAVGESGFIEPSAHDTDDGIMISACILIRTERGRFDEVVERMKQFKETRNVMAVLGRYDVVVDIEVPDYDTLGTTVTQMGKIGGVVFTETLPEMKTASGK
jgi:uncharacterized protein with GYD domain